MKLARLSLCLLLAAPVPASAVSTARNGGDGGVTLRATVPLGGIVNTGDRVAFEYQTRKEAAVIVFSIDSRGYVHLLHPEGGVEVSDANAAYTIPSSGSELIVDTPTGVEFVFALSVAEPSAIDAAELDYLRGTDRPGGEPYRISGDPFIAANMIAGELVRGVSHRDVYFGYTQFYVNQRVEYPCYLCGACDGEADDNACGEYRVVQNFDRRPSLNYPLRRGFDMVEQGAGEYAEDPTTIDTPDGSDVVVNFYPYGSEVRYADPATYIDPYGYGWGLWDPYYWYWPGYYPYWGSGWSIGFGWGWGWGWGGYYCSGWYAPPCYYDGYYPSGGYTYPDRFKTKYKSGDLDSGSLTAQRARAAQRDGDLRIAQKDVQRSVTKANRTSIARSTKRATREAFAAGRAGSPRVKTSVSGAHRGKAAVRGSPGRTGSRPSKGIAGKAPTSRGGSSGTIKRGATSRPRGSSGAVRSPTRGSSGAVKGTPRGSSGRSSSGIRSHGSSRGYSRSAPAMRGGGSSGGGSSAPAARGGGFKGAPRSR
ncbi:MAG TPA: DUF4384 domain-containing protein [Candidatus Krumholzibacteria bacterium]|nr:DUF4384 domain-containing protein [Candidatus Krumholzibacteria bacterium]